MSSPQQRPSRRLPARVYWVRRVVMLLVVLGLGWAAWSLLPDDEPPLARGPGTDSGRPVAEVPTARERSEAGAREQRERRRSEPEPEPGQESRRGAGEQRPPGRDRDEMQLVTTSFARATTGCNPTAVRVQPSVDGAAVAGRAVPLGMALFTTAGDACRLEVTADVLLVQVLLADRAEPIWDAVRCPGSVPARTVTLRPGWQTTLEVAWSGRWGDRGCTGLSDAAEPGAYAVEAAVVGGEPGRSGFVLAASPPAAGTDAAARQAARRSSERVPGRPQT